MAIIDPTTTNQSTILATAVGLMTIVNSPPMSQPLDLWFQTLEQCYESAGIQDSKTKCTHLQTHIVQMPPHKQMELMVRLDEIQEFDENSSYECLKQCILEMWA